MVLRLVDPWEAHSQSEKQAGCTVAPMFSHCHSSTSHMTWLGYFPAATATGWITGSAYGFLSQIITIRRWEIEIKVKMIIQHKRFQPVSVR
jgi:hypothetical protein